MGLSTSGTQHWNAWMVDEDAWGHIDPTAQSLADNWASAYMRPAAKENGYSNWKRVRIGYDPAEVLVNPDGFNDALKLYEARAVGKEYLRAAGSASDTDAPTDEELEEMLFAQTHIQVSISGGKLEEPEPVPAPLMLPPGPSQEPSPNGQPPTGQETPRERPALPAEAARFPEATTYDVLGAAEVAMEEIRSRIGSRLLSHLQGSGCSECLDRVTGVRSVNIASALGPELVMEHGPDLVSLAIGCGENFARVIQRRGVSGAQAAALAEVLELHVVSTVYEEKVGLPAGFVGRVRALEVAA
jgi:hypothetical protein